MDSVESHKRFKAKYDIPFLLLSDPEGTTCRKYGVIKNKKIYGKTVRGIERTTILIDGAGKVTRIFRGVKVEGHARSLLEALSSSRRGT
jgi:thioredoxin-dependent peroxiredoxin